MISAALYPTPVWCVPTGTRRVSAATLVASLSFATWTRLLRCAPAAFFLGCLLCWLPTLLRDTPLLQWIQCSRSAPLEGLSCCLCRAPAVAFAKRWLAPPRRLPWLRSGFPLTAFAEGVCCRTRLTAFRALRPVLTCWGLPPALTRTIPTPAALRALRCPVFCVGVEIQSHRTKPTLRWKRGPDARCSAGTRGPGMNMCL